MISCDSELESVERGFFFFFSFLLLFGTELCFVIVGISVRYLSETKRNPLVNYGLEYGMHFTIIVEIISKSSGSIGL